MFWKHFVRRYVQVIFITAAYHGKPQAERPVAEEWYVPCSADKRETPTEIEKQWNGYRGL